MGALLNLQLDFEREECCECSIVFWAPAQFIRNRRKDKRSFHCPNGHSQAYVESEADRLRKQLEQQKKRTEWAESEAKRQRENAEATQRRLSAQFGENTKLRKRIANGACPCCKRNFSNLARHMKSQHPDFASEAER